MIVIDNKALYQEIQNSLSQETKYEIHRIADRHNIDYQIILKLYIQGLIKGFTPKTSLIGIRLALGIDSSKAEYFSAEDISEITGLTKEEAEQEMISSGKALRIDWL